MEKMNSAATRQIPISVPQTTGSGMSHMCPGMETSLMLIINGTCLLLSLLQRQKTPIGHSAGWGRFLVDCCLELCRHYLKFLEQSKHHDCTDEAEGYKDTPVVH